MDDQLKDALIARLMATADDELILAHRDAEWTGHGPILEEDIALANIAQDELGHAIVIYELIEVLSGRSPDDLTYFREADQFRNVQLVEMPKGDWAYTMLRQYLYDAYEYVLLNAIAQTTYSPLADAVQKFRGEEMYHLRHSHLWVERLGLGTEESNRRLQTALNEQWSLIRQFFIPMPEDDLLMQADFFPDVTKLQSQWEEIVIPHLTASDLYIPSVKMNSSGRESHTQHLTDLLSDFQQVARWDPQGEW